MIMRSGRQLPPYGMGIVPLNAVPGMGIPPSFPGNPNAVHVPGNYNFLPVSGIPNVIPGNQRVVPNPNFIPVLPNAGPVPGIPQVAQVQNNNPVNPVQVIPDANVVVAPGIPPVDQAQGQINVVPAPGIQPDAQIQGQNNVVPAPEPPPVVQVQDNLNVVQAPNDNDGVLPQANQNNDLNAANVPPVQAQDNLPQPAPLPGIAPGVQRQPYPAFMEVPHPTPAGYPHLDVRSYPWLSPYFMPPTQQFFAPGIPWQQPSQSLSPILPAAIPVEPVPPARAASVNPEQPQPQFAPPPQMPTWYYPPGILPPPLTSTFATQNDQAGPSSYIPGAVYYPYGPTGYVQGMSMPSHTMLSWDSRPHNLQKFKGTVQHYHQWFNSFKTLVLESNRSNNQKFEVLKWCLTDVKRVQNICGYTNNEDNFARALDELERFYGNKHTLISEQIQQIRKTKAVKGSDSPEVHDLYSVLSSVVSSCQAHGLEEQFLPEIETAVTEKLPRSVITRWFRDSRRTWQIDVLLDILGEMVEMNTVVDQRLAHRSEPAAKRRKVESHLKNSVSTEILCQFDGENHYYRNCPLSLEKRIQLVKEKKLCQFCLKPEHNNETCRHEKRKCFACKEIHHRYLCPNSKTSDSNHIISSATCFKTLTLSVDQQPIRILFDDGASDSFISSRTVSRLKLQPFSGIHFEILPFGDSKHMNSNQHVELVIGNLKFTLCVVRHFGNMKYRIASPEAIKNIPSQVNYYDDPDRAVDILLGLRDCQVILGKTSPFFQTPDELYHLQETSLGWVIYGGPRSSITRVNHANTVFDLITEVEDSERKDEDNFVEKFVDKHSRYTQGRIEVGLPIHDPKQLESNKNKCFKLLQKQMIGWKKRNQIHIVNEILDDWMEKGIIEESPEDSTQAHYLSYHLVTKESSLTTKHRLVHNASLPGFNGKSLNDCLYKGNTSWSLTKNLIRFRLLQYPLLGDLEKAFLQVQLAPEYRNLFRFFRPNIEKKQVVRFARVPFGSACSPFLLFVALFRMAKDAEQNVPELKDMKDYFYVDDACWSFESETQRNRVQQQLQEHLANYGFNIKWKMTDSTGVLGLRWNVEDDTLQLQSPNWIDPQTNRQLASFIPSIYDPLGIFEPMIVNLRRLFSETWRANSVWDAPIPDETQSRLKPIITFLVNKLDLRIPRWSGVKTLDDLVLHVFVDANDESIGVVVYAQVAGSRQLNWMMAKGKLHRNRTIPEAELDALVLGAQFFRKHFSDLTNKVQIWTDSEVNYHRLRNKGINDLSYHQARKLMNIKVLFKDHDVSVGHISGSDNPADLLTKFKPAKFQWKLWLTPVVTDQDKQFCLTNHTTTVNHSVNSEEMLLAIEEAESLDDLLKRYTLDEMIQCVQRHEWKKELDALAQERRLPKKSQLGPYFYTFTDGILSTKSRLKVSAPKIMLPNHSNLTRLICLRIHRLYDVHQGANTVYKLFSDDYFSRGIRRHIRRMISGCVDCARERGKFQKATFGPLPECRTSIPNHAFQRIGVDFAGPIQTIAIDNKGNRIKGEAKYILVITCLNSRGIFLQLLPEATSQGTVATLKKLSSIYGSPELAYSDNAPCFVKSAKILRELYNGLESALQTLNWKYSLPGAPQTNGATEIMVGLVKKCLKIKGLGKSFTAFELDVMLSEITAIINNRPLFVAGTDVLTPNHLIHGRNLNLIPHVHSTRNNVSLRETVQRINVAKTLFWNEWRQTYITQLRHLQLERPPIQLRVGDTVLYEPFSKTNRFDWNQCTVIATKLSSDGQIRSVDLQLQDETKEILKNRPVIRLVRVPGPEDVDGQNFANQGGHELSS